MERIIFVRESGRTFGQKQGSLRPVDGIHDDASRKLMLEMSCILAYSATLYHSRDYPVQVNALNRVMTSKALDNV